MREAIYYATGMDLTVIEGVDEMHALTLVSELGSDFSKLPTVKHFCSWLSTSPEKKFLGRLVCYLTLKTRSPFPVAVNQASRPSAIPMNAFLGSHPVA